jgi:hypothetical protein
LVVAGPEVENKNLQAVNFWSTTCRNPDWTIRISMVEGNMKTAILDAIVGMATVLMIAAAIITFMSARRQSVEVRDLPRPASHERTWY